MSSAQYPTRSITHHLLAVFFLLLSAAVVQAQGLSPIQDVAQVATGGSHTCILTTSGGVKCWGINSYGQLGDGSTTARSTPVDVVGLDSGVLAVSAGRSHTCALITGGGVKCWGDNYYGTLGDGSTATRLTPTDVTGLSSGVQAISAGYRHSCAVTTSGAKCWGNNGNGRLGDGTTTNRLTPVDVTGLGSGVQVISSGDEHTCALTSGGSMLCWGSNGNGQLGDGSTTQRLAPANVTGLGSGVQAISAGYRYSCALTTNGGMKCWGWNVSGRLGDGSFTQRLTPVDVAGLDSGVQSIGAGDGSTCALTTSAGMKCWGDNSLGQLGDGTTALRFTPVDVMSLDSDVLAFSVGGSHICALTAGGGMKCWGSNAYGQLGDGSVANQPTPVGVTTLGNEVLSISAGRGHTCALTTGGGARCWGSNGNGQLGEGSTTSRLTPVDVLGLDSDVQAVSAGSSHTCALTTGGGVKCWGSNSFGQLGDDSTTDRLTATDVAGLGSGVQAISSGTGHTCALTTGGGVKCWGWNLSGQLGDGSTTNRRTPVDVASLGSGVQAISTTGSHTCAMTATGGMKCWGVNANGHLGDGTTSSRYTPVDVTGLDTGVQAISTGSGHTCALTTNGDMKCWGYNGYGQLGDGSFTQRLTPVDVVGIGSSVQAISTGDHHTCALTTDDGVKCWGSNIYGQIGDGSTTTRSTPVDVVDIGSGVQSINNGISHTCAVTIEGSAKCWGYTQHGQLGIGGRNHALPGDVLVPGDASLSALSLSPVLPGFAFDSEITHYQITVNHGIQTLAFTPVASNPAATITLNGLLIHSGQTSMPLPLTVGINAFVLSVTATDGITQREYRVDVIRLSSAPAQLEVSVTPLGDAFARGGVETRQYRIRVLNVGMATAQDVSLSVPMPTGLTDVAWTCNAANGCTPGAGTSGVTTVFDLSPGDLAHIDLIGEVLPDTAFVDITARASTSSGGGVQAQTSLSDGANGIGLMKNGFED